MAEAKQDACGQCGCDKGGKEVEDLVPDVHFEYQAMFQHANPVDVPYTKMDGMSAGIAVEEIKVFHVLGLQISDSRSRAELSVISLLGSTVLTFGYSCVGLLLLTTSIAVLSNPRGNSRAATFELGVPDDTLHYKPSFLLCGGHPFQFSGRVLEVFLGGLFSSSGGFQGFSFGAPDLEQFVRSGTEQPWALAVPDFLQENNLNLELYSQEPLSSDYLSYAETFAGQAAADFKMSGSSSGPGGGIPLHEFRKDVPPGWAPGLPDCPLRLFFERLKLWYRIFDGADELVGPLVAGRLQGKAQRLGMQLRLVRPDGTYDVGSDALVRLSVEEVRDPANPAHILQHAIPSGVQALCNSLKEAFGMSDQEIVSRSIEDFFEFRRGKLSFQEYAIEWDIRLEEATTKAGLELNDVAKFYLFFRGSGLPQRFVEDIKLQLQGDLRRYQDARTIALRLITKKDDIGDSFYQGDSERGPGDYGDDDDAWSYWTDDSWSYVDEYEVESPYEDHWHDGVYFEDEEYAYDWPGDEAWNTWSGENDTEQHHAAEPDQVPEGQAQESFPMKGKGKGLGCTICGSRWHQASSCPVGKTHKGSGKGKGKGKPYRKGYGKAYGKRPSKGKSKYGEHGWPSYGKAKGKGYYGYSAKTLVGSFGETSSLTKQPKTKTVHFQLDTEEPPVLNLGRPKASEDTTTTEEAEDETSTAPQSNLPEKRLDISFPTAIFNDHMSYHTVLGEKRRGLLVDPGAASGLVGSETLRDIMETCLPTARARDVVWNRDKAQSVSGISGTPESTLGEVSFPLQLAGASGSFSADVLGGEGSLCPALLSNPSLRRQKAAVLCDYFTNGDGVLVVSDGSDGWRYLRILLTDSGHYLLPIDHHASVSEDTKKRVQTQMFTWNSAICSRWQDVRHCFLQKRASRISSFRTTTVRAVSNRSGPQLMEDDWKQARTPCKDVEYLWTGATKFKLLPVPVVTVPSPPTSMATATSSEETALDPLLFPHYDGDRFPDHWSATRISKTAAYYRSIPEEYYSKSGRRPVAPSNFEAWMRQSKDRGSGSGVLDQWTFVTAAILDMSELPILECIHDSMMAQIDCHRGFTIEQPHGSAMLKAVAQDLWAILRGITGPFKLLARSGDYSRITVEVHNSLVLNMEPRLYLKAALMQLVESCMDIFGSGPARDLEHWLTDPILMRVFQEIFADILNVLGVKVYLRPWYLQVPDPHLSSACAPMRLLVSGHLRQWHVGPLEDMRVLSHQQLHAPVDEADWHVYVFGVCSEDYDADRPPPPPPPPPGGSVLPRPSSSAPAAPLVPVEKKNDGKMSSLRPSDLDDEVYEPSEAGEQQEDEEFKAVRPDDDDKEKTLKPLFDFKKVYKRLQTDLLERDPHTAKRLLLGLHERFYHCPISDFKNMLLRAGLFGSASPSRGGVMSCSICRKYVRLPNRPQIKIGAGASSFNLRVQADLFMYKEQWILLMIDEATRYKAAGQVRSREHQELLNKMFEIWFVIFGAPYQLVLDQESSLMSHEACKELERFSVERVPKGATTGAAAQQHTGTGLVERHVGLTEITMMKLSAEMDRQGIVLSTDTLAREIVMSHNMSLNYGGATPSMAVFGIIPRPFYQDDSTGITAVTGALQTDVTPFEKALRIRQMSLSMVQRAVAEDRIARANRTRTQQLALEELVPGVRRVDFHRETQGDLGWRGPAELLNTAILSYQGRPYLVSLRHIRPRQAGVFVTFTDGQEAVFLELQQLVEKLTPYKTVTIGWVPITKDGLTIWHRASSTSLAYKDVWSKVVSLAKSLSTKPTGGAMAGQAVRSIHPPRGSVGVLILWSRGDKTYCCHEHNNDQPLSIKKVTTKPLEETTFLYVYFFASVEYRPDKDMKVIPSEGALEHRSMDTEAEQPLPAEASTSGMDSTTSPALSSPPAAEAAPMEVQEDAEDRKRKGPETRTVVLGPESKRSRVESLIHFTTSEKVTYRAQHVLVNLYWIMHWTQAIPTEFPMVWYGLDNNVSIALWDIYKARSHELPADDPPPHVHRYLFTWPGKQHEELYASLQDGQIYKVDSETDNITEDEMYQIWPQVEAADAAEIKQFVDTGQEVLQKGM
ncbi:hypothetical protein AK812_SmicGene32497 [Symbiodinium microadriaticum]|uniref:Integrase catalytic domain-containing protein n=1 Tax=Symbiodinium microadriaticum TaxID=2951 RepID=A0A1Q9CTZ5_SYMMI|nr:hypothetical protein AK812_SmicGene32497 [Symbiodinium microadriaticum]